MKVDSSPGLANAPSVEQGLDGIEAKIGFASAFKAFSVGGSISIEVDGNSTDGIVVRSSLKVVISVSSVAVVKLWDIKSLKFKQKSNIAWIETISI
jgi:hypothetical protein